MSATSPPSSPVFFFYCSADPRALHSFPTRRSSDLDRGAVQRRGERPVGARPGPARAAPGPAPQRAHGRIGEGPGESAPRSEEHTSELQSHSDLVCRLLLEKKKTKIAQNILKSIIKD